MRNQEIYKYLLWAINHYHKMYTAKLSGYPHGRYRNNWGGIEAFHLYKKYVGREE